MFVCLKVDDDVMSYGSIQYNGEVPCPRIKYDTFGGSIAFGSVETMWTIQGITKC